MLKKEAGLYLLKISATEISNRAIQVRPQPLRSGITQPVFAHNPFLFCTAITHLSGQPHSQGCCLAGQSATRHRADC